MKKFISTLIVSFIALLTFYIGDRIETTNNNGWTHLFNGNDLKSWEILNGKAEIKVSNNLIDEFVEIHVSDSGSGISEDHVPYVFERFYKVDKSRSDHGTGLGLAIVKHLVQAHGGEVGLSSVEGEGSSFTFTLPLGKTEKALNN